MSTEADTIQSINEFRELCIDMATGKDFSYDKYENARNAFIANDKLNGLLPNWLIKNRYGSQFWSFIKAKFSTYQERRDFLNDEFARLTDSFEKDETQPVSISVNELFAGDDTEEIERIWSKVLHRKASDPEGAITAARTLVETTLKYILDQSGETYTNKDELSDLYKKVAKTLNLSPSGHNEQLFKQILTGITSIIQGFASLRNSYGDAHGKGKIHYVPEARHVELTVNLAGTVCAFLVKTYKEQRPIK